MANIKISELNELETRHRNDLLAIVDTNNNETKKIKVENLINENVELIAVSPTAPSECSLGDKYFNTTSNKLYTATATNTWSSTGENAVEGILYIVFNEQSTYAYNGTTLVSVGGGSGSSDIVVVPTETPTEETKLEIEDEDFDFKGSEITDEYSESTEVGYSANYSNGHFQGKIEKGRVYANTMTGGNDVMTKNITFDKEYTNVPIVITSMSSSRSYTYYGATYSYVRNATNTGCTICANVNITNDANVWIDYIVISMD